MRYSIIGSGNIGTALARQFARTGIPAAIANARGPASLAALRTELGEQIEPQSMDAALRADVVILAVPFAAVGVVAGAGAGWSGKIVVDATNALDFPSFAPTDLGGRPSSELVAEKLPGARLVKAFNTLPAAVLAADPSQAGGRRVLFVSGNDAAANTEISGLIQKLGFVPIVLGRLAEGGLVQQYGGPLMGQNLVQPN